MVMFSQRQTAKALGVNRKTVVRWLRQLNGSLMSEGMLARMREMHRCREARAVPRGGRRLRIPSRQFSAFFPLFSNIACIGIVLLAGYGCCESPPRKLCSKTKVGEPVADFVTEAKTLGFRWDAYPSEGQHIICHYRGDLCTPGKHGATVAESNPEPLVCEDFEKGGCFGMMFTSDACNIRLAGGRISEAWFYQD